MRVPIKKEPNMEKKAGIIKITDLNKHNYKTLVYACFGSLNDIIMSKRLQNVLTRNNVLYLSQLSKYSRERIFLFRNLDPKTMLELESICKEYGIHIYSPSTTKEALT